MVPNPPCRCGTVIATSFARLASHPVLGVYPPGPGADVYSCDYNGWADVPEEEREGIDAFETGRPPTPPAPARTAPEFPQPVLGTPRDFTRRKAA